MDVCRALSYLRFISPGVLCVCFVLFVCLFCFVLFVCLFSFVCFVLFCFVCLLVCFVLFVCFVCLFCFTITHWEDIIKAG